MNERVDVLIVGAGLSGIGAACHLRRELPGKSFAILEGRESIGGTWDLFRYPGIRSDSDMLTFGYSFEPWRGSKALADGASILAYIRETARKYEVDRAIRFGHRVTRASWSTADAVWTIEATRADGTALTITASFLWMCTGYYRYEAGHTPEFPGRERFRGPVVHPQRWPEGLDYAGKRVAVIGSGATAVTLVPAMAGDAAHVTMVQRSPTYIMSLPGQDPVAAALRRLLPERVAYPIARWKNITLATFIYQLARRRPERMKTWLIDQVRRTLGPGHDVATDFTPRYMPWDQRLCFVPDGDLFAALRAGKASVATGAIETFTETGLRLDTGEEVEADVIVTATGLDLLFFGGAELVVDGATLVPHELVTYKGVMLSGVPNLAFTVGYINSSWTLRADLIARHVCDLLRHLDRRGARVVTPRRGSDVETERLLGLSSGYVERSVDRFPRQGTHAPWRAPQNYFLDLASLRLAPLASPALDFE